MKALWLSLVLLLLCSCAALQQIPLPDLSKGEPLAPSLQEQTRQSCEEHFVSGNWQFVHAISFEMASGHGATVLGVTVLDGEDIKTGLMTVEGFVLFEAELDTEKKLQVNRALPPFDNSEFTMGLMEDVQTIFLLPSKKTPVMARSADGDLLCRYDVANGNIIDVIPGTGGSNVIHVYDPGQTRIKTITADTYIPVDSEMIPENIQLTAQGLQGYTLKMTLISAEQLQK